MHFSESSLERLMASAFRVPGYNISMALLLINQFDSARINASRLTIDSIQEK